MTGVRSISPFDRILYLKSLPVAGGLSGAQVGRLASEAEEVSLDPGEMLLTEGTVTNHFYIVASGTVRMSRPDAPEWKVRAPETVGFVEMLAGDDRASAVAESGVVALRFERVRVLEVYEEDFALLQNSVRALARAHLALLRSSIAGSVRAPWKPLVAIPRDRDLDLLERLIMIRQGNLFAAVGLEAGVLLATSMTQVSWRAGETIWKHGDPAGSLFIIIDGLVDGRLPDGTGFEAGLGYPLGNLESLAQRARWYDAVARTDVIAFRADHESFFDVMEDDFGVAEAFLEAMCTGILHSHDTLLRRGQPIPEPEEL